MSLISGSRVHPRRTYGKERKYIVPIKAFGALTRIRATQAATISLGIGYLPQDNNNSTDFLRLGGKYPYPLLFLFNTKRSQGIRLVPLNFWEAGCPRRFSPHFEHHGAKYPSNYCYHVILRGFSFCLSGIGS